MKVCELISALRIMPKYAEVVFVSHDNDPGTWNGIVDYVSNGSEEDEATGSERGYTDGIVVLSP